jgi:hypothetical protein
VLAGRGWDAGLTWCVTLTGTPSTYAGQRAKDWLEQRAGSWLRVTDPPGEYPYVERDGMCRVR